MISIADSLTSSADAAALERRMQSRLGKEQQETLKASKTKQIISADFVRKPFCC